jgi:protein-S-isoprenylcysteine O-methyltransferase Ste14
MGLAAAAYGLFCYVVFLASFLNAIGFIGNIVVPKTIDTGTGAPFPAALLIDAALLGLFAVQHSVMARQGFKALWTRIVPPAVERSTYVLISSLLLDLICWKWQAIPTVVWDISSPMFSGLITALFALGWLVLLVSTFMINHFDLFGLRQVYLRLRGIDYTPLNFTARALLQIRAPPTLPGVHYRLLGDTSHVSWAPRVLDCDHRVHICRNFLGRTRSYEASRCGVWRLPRAGSDAVADGRKTPVIRRRTPTYKLVYTSEDDHRKSATLCSPPSRANRARE